MLVEVYFLIMLLHADIKLLRRPPPLPPVIRILQTVIALGKSNVCYGRLGAAPDIQVSKEKPAQMRHISDVPAARHGERQGDHDQNPDEILGFNQKRERNHHDFALRKQHAKRNENREYSARRAYRRSSRTPTKNMAVRESNRC